MTTSVIVAGARTPVGKLMGALKDFSGSDLGAVAIAGAAKHPLLRRAIGAAWPRRYDHQRRPEVAQHAANAQLTPDAPFGAANEDEL